ncbi:hypothetical protein V2O64_10295 [Verrucomicrobiaceae bacterium 227]
MAYLGLKSEDVPEVNLKKSRHWFSLWRMDLLPIDHEEWCIGGCFEPLVLTNATTRFTCVNKSLGSTGQLRENFETFFNSSLYLGHLPGEAYGRCRIRFVRGSHRVLARWMNQLFDSFVPVGASREEIERLDKIDEEFWDVPYSRQSTETVKERWIEFLKKDPPKLLPFRPGWGEPSKVIPFPKPGDR